MARRHTPIASWRRRFSRMANKRERASMREGPLADLFRRTDEESEEQRERRPEEGAEPTSETEARPPEAEQHTPPAHEHRPAAEPARPTGPPPSDEAPSVPTPRERLRHAFSSDIPANILERPEPPEPYPTERGDLYAAPAPTGA